MQLEEREELKLEKSPAEVWEEARELLKKKLKLPTYQSWVLPIRMQELDAENAVIAVNNAFTRGWIMDNIERDIRAALALVLGREVQLRVTIDDTIQSANDYTPSIANITVAPEKAPERPPAEPSLPSQFEQDLRRQTSNLNPKYTFETFIVGDHNNFCYSAASAVAHNPGTSYNPLFIYGGVGLGKTHIMQAIGHHVMRTNPKLVVRYLSSETFTNEVIAAIREQRQMDFRKRYRQADLLLMDDVQFLAGKEAIQEELFHTFNTLRESGRQIVFTSDRPPKELQKMEERLRSRFEWGLIADMSAPNLETRLAILQKKCETDKMTVSPEVLEYIASVFTNNIRELEGALLRAHAYASLTGGPLNIQTAANVLQIGTRVSQKNTLTVESIISAVAAHYRVDTSDLRSAKRSQDLALPRHVAMFLAHDLLSMSHSRIGESFGNRKHSSVIYAIDKVKAEMAENVQLSHAIQQIRRQLSV